MIHNLATFTAFAVFAASAATVSAQVTVDFEDLTLPGPSTFYNGSDGAAAFTSSGATFNNFYDDTFGPFWSGWSYSNTTDSTTAGFGNQYSASPGSGFAGSANYGVAFVDEFGLRPSIALPAGLSPESIRVTNTTYTLLSVRDGNDAAGFVRQFGDDPNISGTGNQGEPDFLRLLITGRDDAGDVTGNIEFFLADYRFADNSDDLAIDQWELIDLRPLGSATRTLEFDLETTDLTEFDFDFDGTPDLVFSNTPLYFAADNLVLTAAANNVPEPSSLAMIVVAAAVAFAFSRVRRRCK